MYAKPAKFYNTRPAQPQAQPLPHVHRVAANVNVDPLTSATTTTTFKMSAASPPPPPPRSAKKVNRDVGNDTGNGREPLMSGQVRIPPKQIDPIATYIPNMCRGHVFAGFSQFSAKKWQFSKYNVMITF
jgi:hypothetical protein